ncbi:MAG: hypothetical protein M0Z51_06465 [Propionibacterium sp.]|nr:hypothetical protein [Propionibacterium sp.]
MRAAKKLAATLLATAALAGCGSAAGTAAIAPSPKGPELASSAPSASSTPSAMPTPAIDYDTGARTTPDVAPTWDASARSTAATSAQAVVAAFARHDLDPTSWWAGLSPLLSARAQLDYSGVDPAAVPAHEVTGVGQIIDDSSAAVAKVTVPTDAGTYTVILSRTGEASPWLAEQIQPPAGTH